MQPLGVAMAALPGHRDTAVAETSSPALGARTVDFSPKVAVRKVRPDTFRRIGPKARAVQTMARLSIGKERELGAVPFILEYSGAGNRDETDVPVPALEASQGRISEAQIQLNRESGTLRVALKICPGASESAELRLALLGVNGGAETWLYRWTKGMHQ